MAALNDAVQNPGLALQAHHLLEGTGQLQRHQQAACVRDEFAALITWVLQQEHICNNWIQQGMQATSIEMMTPHM